MIKNKKDKISTSIGLKTGVYLTPHEMEALKEIITEVKKTSIISVKGSLTEADVQYKKPKTQADIFALVRKLAEKHGLPQAFYAVDSFGQFILVNDKEESFHESYNL